MKTLKMGIMLLAFLLAAMVMVPMVNASGGINYSLASDVSTLSVPQLHFNTSQKHVTVNTELDPDLNTQVSDVTHLIATSQNPSISKIPYGSIIYHSKNGITTVFDANGNQLFAAEDANSTNIPTPDGLTPATHVHGVPSGSVVTFSGNIAYVSYQNVLLFREIDLSTPTGLTASSVTPQVTDPQYYVEGIDGTPTSSSLGNYGAEWTVPSNPSQSVPGSPVFLWDGVQSNGNVPGSSWPVLIQPVLQWNVESGEWSMASWLIYGTNGDLDVKTNDVTGVSSGDVILGQMLYNPNSLTWTITTEDTSRSTAATLTATNWLPNSNVAIEVYLESWAQGLPSFMPGPASFYSFVVHDTNGNNCYPSTDYYRLSESPLPIFDVEYC